MPKVKLAKSTLAGHALTTKPNHHTKVPVSLRHIPAHFLQSWGDRSYQKGGVVLPVKEPSPSPPPAPPPQVRRSQAASPGWQTKKAFHPTRHEDRGTSPLLSPPHVPLVMVKEEDIDCEVANLQFVTERVSDYRVHSGEHRDDLPKSTYYSSRSVSPAMPSLPDIVITESDSTSPSPPSSPLTPRHSHLHPYLSPAQISSFNVPEQFPTGSRIHRRSLSDPCSTPPQSPRGAGRRTLYDAISKRQLPRPAVVEQCHNNPGLDGDDSAFVSHYDWRDVRAPRKSNTVAVNERRYRPYMRSLTPVLPDLDLPRFVQKNNFNKDVPLPSFCALSASEEPPSPFRRQTSHLAYYSD